MRVVKWNVSDWWSLCKNAESHAGSFGLPNLTGLLVEKAREVKEILLDGLKKSIEFKNFRKGGKNE